jgi:hypothetical protein
MDRIRESLPEEVRQARELLAQRNEILSEAQQKADALVLDAQAKADRLLAESTLMQAVREEAVRVREAMMKDMDVLQQRTLAEVQALRAEAEAEARSIREGAARYADTVLGGLAQQIGEVSSVVREGQHYLSRVRQGGQPACSGGTSSGLPPKVATPYAASGGVGMRASGAAARSAAMAPILDSVPTPVQTRVSAQGRRLALNGQTITSRSSAAGSNGLRPSPARV